MLLEYIIFSSVIPFSYIFFSVKRGKGILCKCALCSLVSTDAVRKEDRRDLNHSLSRLFLVNRHEG